MTTAAVGSGRSALVLGATGLVGGHCLDLLLADAAYARVVAPVRRPSGRTDAGLEERVVDFDRLEDDVDAFRVDDVFCCLGTTIRAAGSREAFRRVDHDYVAAAARLAANGGARQFLLVTALGADADSRIFYNRVKGEAEQAVRALPFRRVVLVRPSLLLGDRDERRPGEEVGKAVMGALAPLMVGPLRKYRAIAGCDVARAMVRLAKEATPETRVVESDELARLAA